MWSDTTANQLKVNVGGTATEVGVSSFSSSATVSYSETIGDYSQPTSATATSEASLPSVTADAVWGDAKDQVIENFTTYATQGAADADWVPQDTAKGRVNITTDVLDFIGDRDTTNDAVIFDLGSNLSNTAWILRFKLTYSAAAVADVSGSTEMFGVYSADGTTDGSTAQDMIGYGQQYNTTNWFSKPGFVDNNTVQGAVDPNSALTTDFSSTVTYYVEIIRLSATSVKYTLYSDSGYSTSVATSTETVSSSIQSLRYVGWKNTTSGGTVTGGFTNTIDDIQIWDGITTFNGLASYAVDDSVSEEFYWLSSAEANPSIYVDCGGSATNLLGCALYVDSDTTETEIQIRCSADTTFTAGEATRTILVSNLTAGAWNYIRWNLVNQRYMQIYGNSGSSLVLALNQIKYLTKTDAQVLQDLGVIDISATDTSLALDGT